MIRDPHSRTFSTGFQKLKKWTRQQIWKVNWLTVHHSSILWLRQPNLRKKAPNQHPRGHLHLFMAIKQWPVLVRGKLNTKVTPPNRTKTQATNTTTSKWLWEGWINSKAKVPFRIISVEMMYMQINRIISWLQIPSIFSKQETIAGISLRNRTIIGLIGLSMSLIQISARLRQSIINSIAKKSKVDLRIWIRSGFKRECRRRRWASKFRNRSSP